MASEDASSIIPVPMLIIVMGVSGTGKSTLAKLLSTALHIPFVDGDDLHPTANIKKMTRGEALNDADRAPWLKIVRATGVRLVSGRDGGAVLACSALKQSYRQILRGKVREEAERHGDGTGGGEEEVVSDSFGTYFVWITGEKSVLVERMEKREGHYMKASMLDSQLKALESPAGEENVVVIPLELSPADQLSLARDGLSRLIGARV